MKEFYNNNLELCHFPSLSVYRKYLRDYCSLSDVRRIYQRLYSFTSDYYPFVADKKIYYVSKIMEYYLYDCELF